VRTAGFHAVVVLLVILIGCGRSDVIAPVAPLRPAGNMKSSQTRVLWGLWDVTVSQDHSSAEVVPLRDAAFHFNLVRMLEFAPCSDCLKISNIVQPEPGEIRADLRLTHPVPGNLNLTGFDVRGIFITGSDFTFPELGRSVALGQEYPGLMNADGYTQLYNPEEFEENVPGPYIFKYISGKFSPGGNLDATLNPYLSYCDEMPRRMFLPGETNTRTAVLRVPDGPLRFGYAVDACWVPVGEKVTDPVEDFPEEANCLEAFRIEFDAGSSLGVEPGSEINVQIDIHDHQAFSTLDDVVVEAPDLFEGLRYPVFHNYAPDGAFIYRVWLENEPGAGEGEYPVLVQVIDDEEDANLGNIDAWQIGTVVVGEKKGWVKTWGADGRDSCWDLDIAEDGTVYVAGTFEGTVDFDPGPGVEEHTATGSGWAYLSRFTPSGELEWVRTWGRARAGSLVVDESGNVLVGGWFWGVVDFDPGGGVEERETGQIYSDAYVSRFDSSGNFINVNSWGKEYVEEKVNCICNGDMGSTLVTGIFSGTVDFDPGPGVEERTSNGEEDVFLARYDHYNELEWVGAWGGPGGVSEVVDDASYSVASDSTGMIYVSGKFHSTCDFDPGPAIEEHVPIGWQDGFLVKYNSFGTLQWARTFGGTQSGAVLEVAEQDSSGVVISGYYSGLMDFDPGPGIEEHATNGTSDGFVASYTSGGDFEWVRIIGGTSETVATSLTTASNGDILVTGFFSETIDLNPGPAEDQYSSFGFMDAYLARLDVFGEYLWGRTWGGAGNLAVYIDDEGTGVEVDADGNIYMTGHFENTVDFEPGSGTQQVNTNGLWDACVVKYQSGGIW